MRNFCSRYGVRLVAGLVLLLGFLAYREHAREPDGRLWQMLAAEWSEPLWTVRYDSLERLPAGGDGETGLHFDRIRELIHTGAGTPYLAVEDLSAWGIPAVQHVRLRFRNNSSHAPLAVHEFVMWYVPERAGSIIDGGGPRYFAEEHRARGLPLVRGGEIAVEWHLPMPVQQFHIVFPPNVSLEFVAFELVGNETLAKPNSRSQLTQLAKILLAGAFLLVGVALLRWFWRTLAIGPGAVKKLLILCTGISAVTLVFLLPPFQAPDERAHWQAALEFYRTNPRDEVPLYNLHEVLRMFEEEPGTSEPRRHWIAFRPHNTFPAELLRTETTDEVKSRLRNPAPTPVPYAGIWSYPSVGVVSLIFPHVETLNEALLFFYACRLLNVAALLAVLTWANRQGGLPYTGLLFFSLPLVLQQCVSITNDAAAIVGTLLAVQMCLRLREGFDWRFFAGFLATCMLTTLSKMPTYAGVWLLGLLLVPYRKLPYKAVVIPAMLVAALFAGWLAAAYGVERLLASEEGPNVQVHLEDFRQRGVAGAVGHVSKVWWQVFERSAFGDSWFQPLGYIDTVLSELHRVLIYCTLALAVLFDLAHFVPAAAARARNLWREWSMKARPRCRELVGRFAVRLVLPVMTVGVAGVNFLLVTMVTTLSMYVLYSDVGSQLVWGLQVRYWFPAAVLLLFSPVFFLRPLEKEQHDNALVRIWSTTLSTTAVAFLPLLFLARQVELVIDLLVRYW